MKSTACTNTFTGGEVNTLMYTEVFLPGSVVNVSPNSQSSASSAPKMPTVYTFFGNRIR